MPNIFRTCFSLGRQTEHQTRITDNRSDYQGQRLADKLTTKRPRNTEIGRKVVHHTGDNAHQFQSQRSKVKITRPINAYTLNAQYLLKGKFCPVPQHNSRTERPRKPKFGRIENHHTCNQ